MSLSWPLRYINKLTLGEKMYNGYQNQEIAAADAEFQRQLAGLAKSGQYSQQALNYIASVWERDKVMAYNSAKSALNSPLFGSSLSQFVQKVIGRIVSEATTGGQPGYNYGMQPNPYANPMFGYAPIPSQIPMQSPFACNTYRPMQGIQYAPQVSVQSGQEQATYAPLPETRPQQEIKPATEPAATVGEPAKTLTIQKVNYTAPTAEENDTAYGDVEHHTAIGTIKVTAMRDCDRVPFKQVCIRLQNPCRNKLEALNQAKLIYKHKGISHIDIQYDLACTIDIPYDKLKKVINSIKKAIPSTDKAANQLKYLQAIQKILDAESRGVANILEEFLVDRFNYIGSIGCVSSDYNGSLKVESIRALINLSDKDTADPACQAWQAKEGFNTALVKSVNGTIKKDMLDCVILDPSNVADLKVMLRHYTGLTESDEGNLVDVGMELLPNVEAFSKATAKEKATAFGEAGEIITGSSVIILKNQHLVVTDFIPDSTAGRTSAGELCVVSKTTYIGGYTNNEPNPCDSNFEYMIIKSSMGYNFWADIIVNTDNLMYAMKCVECSDKWYAIVPTTL